MEIAAAVVGSILSCACSSIDTPTAEKAKYIKSPTKELETLRTKTEELTCRVSDINNKLKIAEERGKTATSEVKNWLNKVDKLMTEVDGLEQKAKVVKTCFNGFSPNCRSRLNYGKRVSDSIKEVTDLLDKASRFSEDSLAFVVSEVGLEMVTTRLMGKTTAEKNSEMVWECLMDAETGKVGVYGMGGVGKTTIMKNINNRLLQERRFDKVIWVTVSKDVSLQKVQQEIANSARLDLKSEQDEAKKSSLLFRTLHNMGRFVIILDDMWESFSLHEIGIPEPYKENGCKLVLTTRSLEVCNRMQCQKLVKVEILSEDEAWDLFIHTVGMGLDPEKVKIAKAIVEKCARLPLAIIIVGGAMRGKDDIREWRVALSDLRESTKWIIDMEVQVIECLKFSYNNLGEDTLKRCFLYCALYPEDYLIDSNELIDHWVMEGLIKGRNMEDESDRGHLVVSKLIRCCMLELGGDSPERVKMHDLIREMALRITRTNPRFMVKAGSRLMTLQFEEQWGEDLEKVSFIKSDIEQISISPRCPGLVTLLLFRNPLKNIAHDFFVQMQSLRVLDLRHTGIEFLPDSVSNLVNLRALLLSMCQQLKSIPSLSKVQLLEVLDLEATAIEELPEGMENLVNLKRLNLDTTYKMRETIPTGLISKFSSLQELNLKCVQVDKIYEPRRQRDFVEELLCLTQLENIFVTFREFSDYNSYVGSEKFRGLKEFNFLIGIEQRHVTTWGWTMYRKRAVHLCNSHGIPGDALFLPPNTLFFLIQENRDLERLMQLENLKVARDLRECWVCECSAMYCILSSEDEKWRFFSLEHLEKMIIRCCPKLSTICKGVPRRVFPCLKELYIFGCRNLKNLFTSKFLKQLKNLERLWVDDSDEMEELITEYEEDMDEEGSCSRLRELHLNGLPQLKCTWTRVLKFSNSWQSLFVGGCGELKTFLSTRVLQHLQSLEEIHVLDCGQMEELIVEEESDKGSNDTNNITLSKLQILVLSSLPKLQSIWNGVMICDSLQTVCVEKCAELKRFPQISGEDQSPPTSLERIQGSGEWWDSLELEHPYAKNLLQYHFKPTWR